MVYATAIARIAEHHKSKTRSSPKWILWPIIYLDDEDNISIIQRYGEEK